MPDFDTALDDDIGDELLRLIFTACHPPVARSPRSTGAADDLRPDHEEEIARAFTGGGSDLPSASMRTSGRSRTQVGL